MENGIFDLMQAHDYENIFFCQEKTLGLKAIIAIHNNRIKVVNLETHEVKSVAGTGVAGYQDGGPDAAMFNEPDGLFYADGKLYVADTNNHAIRLVDLATGNVETLPVQVQTHTD